MTFDYPTWHEIPGEIKILRDQFTEELIDIINGHN